MEEAAVTSANLRDLRWRSLVHGGLEQVRVAFWPEAIKIRGAIVGAAGAQRHGVLYELSLRLDWTFEAMLIQRTDGRMDVLRHGTGDDGWFDMQAESLPALAGCIDIDFEMTPLTNTLPIRRLGLAIGESRRIRVAYIPADTLEAFADEQIYTRLDATRYRFEEADGSFSAEITVDDEGFVTHYPGLFERV